MDERPEMLPSPEEVLDLPEPPEVPLPSSRDPAWEPIAVLTAVHAALLRATGSHDPERLVEVGALAGWPPAAEAYRLVTANFLHADLAHLAVNTAYLVVFGFAAIRLFGLRWSALAYAVGAVSSSVASVLIVPWDVPSVGSSGCVFALAGATIAGRLRLAAASRLPRRERWRLAGLAAVLLSGALSANWAAHLGGALAGSLLGALLPFAGRGSPRAARLAGAVGLAALALPWAWRIASP